ncbi:MAG: hypothetical protein LBG87_01125 [Spirochaetaceae bacterium]|nr:hypothetical protein [Spirochaetaceae bacterium]
MTPQLRYTRIDRNDTFSIKIEEVLDVFSLRKDGIKNTTILDSLGIQICLCFGIPWTAFFLCSLLGREWYYFWGTGEFWERLARLPQQIWFYLNFLPGIFFSGIGVLIHYVLSRKKTFDPREMTLPIFILILLDQTVQFFMTKHPEIQLVAVENWLTIIPVSTQFKTGGYASTGLIPLPIHLAVNIFLLIPVAYALYKTLYFFEQNTKRIFMSILFYGAGWICSCLNLLIHKGGYDYIKLYPLIILDLKDIYIDIALCTVAHSALENARVLKNVSMKAIKKYWLCELKTFLKRFSPENTPP